MNPFDIMVNYQVVLRDDSNCTQQFVLFRCGLLLLIDKRSSDCMKIVFGEVKCSPKEFLKSIKDEEDKVVFAANGGEEDWGGWWEDIKFEYANLSGLDDTLVLPDWIIANISQWRMS